MQDSETVDCVEMKNTIQAERLREYQGPADERVRSNLAEKLATSDDSVARKWQRIGKPVRESAAVDRVA